MPPFGDDIKNMWTTIQAGRRVELLKVREGWLVQTSTPDGDVKSNFYKTIADAQLDYESRVSNCPKLSG